MELSDFYTYLVNRLLTEQMENGEFGLSRNQSVVGVASPYHNAYVPGKKANSFVTMYSIELLHKLKLDPKKVRKATAWFERRISEDGYFLSDVSIPEQVEDVVTGRIITVSSTVKIYRHTAEALYSLFLVDGISRITIKMLTNLLAAQNSDGGWSASSSNSTSQLLSTSFTLKAISALPSYEIASKGFAPFEQEEKKHDIEAAVSMALRWFSLQSKSAGGLWYLGMEREENKAFYTGIILGMSPHLFVCYAPEMTLDLVKQLIACSTNGIWMRDAQIDIDGSARILAALVKLRKLISFEFDFDKSISMLQTYVEPKINTIDPATLCFIIDALFEYKGISNHDGASAVNAVVAIYSDNSLLGSGFVVGEGKNTFCITCKHIFKNVQSKQCMVAFGDGESTEFTCDLIPETLNITAESFACDDIMVIPLPVRCKHPLEMQPTISDSVYSSFGYGVSTGGRGRWSKSLSLMGQAAKGFYQVNCSDGVIESGFSGSPIFNSKYEVIGMIQAIRGQTVYMIPASTLKGYIKRRLDNEPIY